MQSFAHLGHCPTAASTSAHRPHASMRFPQSMRWWKLVPQVAQVASDTPSVTDVEQRWHAGMAAAAAAAGGVAEARGQGPPPPPAPRGRRRGLWAGRCAAVLLGPRCRTYVWSVAWTSSAVTLNGRDQRVRTWNAPRSPAGTRPAPTSIEEGPPCRAWCPPQIIRAGWEPYIPHILGAASQLGVFGVALWGRCPAHVLPRRHPERTQASAAQTPARVLFLFVSLLFPEGGPAGFGGGPAVSAHPGALRGWVYSSLP